jgi:UDP-N-acetylmuramoyl-tripeptide--D-alanyl-D-alanine ligase
MRLSDFVTLTAKKPDKFKNFDINGFNNDSRKVMANDVFVAIKTDSNDGNLFVEDAHQKGAKAFIVSKKDIDVKNLENIFFVKDTVSFLGSASSKWLLKHVDKTIGITGSAGKTTTKELIGHILKSVAKTEVSEGNYNNTIGLPLTILNNIKTKLDYYVAEMGMSYKGEINTLVSLYKPNVRILLNVLTAHLGNFDTIDDLRDAKAEILNNREPEDMVIFNRDNLLVKTRVQQEVGLKWSFGFDREADFVIKNFASTLTKTKMAFSFNGKDYTVEYNLSGKHNCYNVAAGVLTTLLLGVDFKDIKNSLLTFQPVSQRGGVWVVDGITIYDDSYNSNPDALKSVLTMLSDMQTDGRKVAVIGDMLELGMFSKARHIEIGSVINTLDIDVVVCFGQEMKYAFNVIDDKRVEKYWFPSSVDAANEIKTIVDYKDTVIVKASRGMKGEVIISSIEGV